MRMVRPMGAVTPTKEKLEKAYASSDWHAEPKMDGSRYIAQIIDGKVFLTSRRESVKGGMVDKTLNVPHIIEELSKLPNCILDGEIDNRDIRDFHRVQGIMGSLPDKAWEKQGFNIKEETKPEILAGIIYPKGEGPLVYKVFDILEINGMDLRPTHLAHRMIHLKIIKDMKYVLRVPMITGEENKRKAFEEAINNGMEGIILKNRCAPYVEDKKPANVWYKVKLCNTYDGVVVGYKMGEGKYKDTLGTLTISQYKDGKLTEVAEISGMTDAQRNEFKNRIDGGDLNWVVEFKAQETDANGRYRHPRFARIRLDKAPTQCKYGEA
jgi:ATP-dependent DNA ligase